MTATKTLLQDALLIDFTASVDGFTHLKQFGPEFISMVRERERKGSALVVVDRAVGMPITGPVVISDHLNLTGTNPLLGPNDPCGDRFPVVQGIYVVDQLPELPRVVVAGIKEGAPLGNSDVDLMRQFNVDTCCYNAVSAMIIAAHARTRLLAILLPENQALPAAVLHEIQKLTGAK